MQIRVFAALALSFVSSAAAADTWIDNVNGIQIDEQGQIERFAGLIIGDDGKVAHVLAPGQSPPITVTAVVDGGGQTLLPGLIDAHGHVMGLGTAAIRLDLTGSASLDELQSRLRNYASANPEGWVLGRGWNQELWPGKRMPTASDLDAVVGERPVALERVDGHALVVNSAALRAAGITASAGDPPGGKIERDSDGNPTGLLIDAAASLVERHIPALTEAQRRQALAEAQRRLLETGITATADMGTSVEDWNTYLLASNAGDLKIRIIGYAAGTPPLQRIPEPRGWMSGDHLQLRGVKLYADGALGSRGAWLKQPYADAPQTSALAVTAPDELRRQAAEAATKGFQVAIHAIGDRANAEVISIFEELGRAHPGDRRWRIEHAQVIDPLDIPRLATAGIIASMQPIHQVSDRTMAEARLGPDRLEGAYAWQTIARSGARLAFGSDFPVEPPNPFLGLSAAVSRQDPNGIPPGGWIPNERLSFEQALAGFTRGAAFAGFAEDRIGSLEPGKWADFIIIDRDPTRVDAQQLARTQVLETWIAGEKVWERPASPGAAGERGK